VRSAVKAGQSNVGDNQRPFSGFQLRQEHLGVRNDANAPALRIQDLAQSALALRVVIQNQDANLAWRARRGGTHSQSIARGCRPEEVHTSTSVVSANERAVGSESRRPY